MTKKQKERKADALLSIARNWQNRKQHCSDIPYEDFLDAAADFNRWDLGDAAYTLASSLALSEVAGMGFDIVNHDGSECEKVARVAVKYVSNDTGLVTYSMRTVRR